MVFVKLSLYPFIKYLVYYLFYFNLIVYLHITLMNYLDSQKKSLIKIFDYSHKIRLPEKSGNLIHFI
jgi:hypothetical protein